MVTIKCSVYEKYDFLKLIEYAKQNKYKDYEDGKINHKFLELDIEVLDRLKNRVNGICREDYQDQSTKA